MVNRAYLREHRTTYALPWLNVTWIAHEDSITPAVHWPVMVSPEDSSRTGLAIMIFVHEDGVNDRQWMSMV